MINDTLPSNILGPELLFEPSQFSFAPRELQILDIQTKVVFVSSNSLLDISKWLRHCFSDFSGGVWPDLSFSKKKFWKILILKKVIGKMKVVFVSSTKNIN